jgi:hypothetical protein
MVLQEMNLKLQLKYEEYVETWSSLLQEYFSRGLDRQITGALELNDEKFIQYSMELASVILFTGMRYWMTSKISADIKEKVRGDVVDAFYAEIYRDKAGTDFLSICVEFFNERYKTFLDLCPDITGKNREKQRAELIGLTRYICARVSGKPEEQNLKVFEQLGLIFVSLASASEKLTRNSSLDIQFPLGKPKFIVQK